MAMIEKTELLTKKKPHTLPLSAQIQYRSWYYGNTHYRQILHLCVFHFVMVYLLQIFMREIMLMYAKI